ncbi:hypothetical protein QQS21_007636 [Conoideocrella luteorostrata]|uniref:LysM domain-containing protein n=1 Tax=Conoideocrella luteorostrata TaxID=1105319 RepID=A0AAJ0FZB3_9HYPO|nr:hypothetical protein QQS21_007636 [Conoideocrella luteorostrata]
MAFRAASVLFLLVSQLQIAVAQDKSPGGPVHEGQPANCNAWHTIVKGDTCDTVPKKYGITRAKFLEWNPAVSSDCITNFWLGNAYCVGIGPRATTSTSKVTSKPTTSTSSSKVITTSMTTTQNLTYSTREPITTWNITTPLTETKWPPKATQSGQPAGCNRWHFVVAGDTCDSILNRYGRYVTIEQLHKWNPELHDDCSGLYADYWICVSMRGIGENPDLGWSSSTPPFTAPPPPTSHHTTVFPTANSSFSPVPSQGPMPSNCKNFHKVSADENCQTILSMYSYITEKQFFDWNPVLKGNCFGLWLDNWYCVGAFDNNYPMPPTVTATPSPVPNNSPGDCKSWYRTTVDDTCDVIASMFGTFKREDFIKWNPSVFDDCTAIKQNTWYCVGKAGTPTTRSSGAPQPTGPESSRPTQSGIAKDCSNYWLVSQTDTCKSIAAANGISETSLRTWNPALGSDCKGLAADYYVCVAVGSSSATSTPPPIQTGTKTTSAKVSASSTSPSSTPISTPSPTREGMTSQCRRFYLMQPGDLCWSMAQSAGVSLAQFVEWNPAVGQECGNLWPAYYYCIGVAGPVTTITSGPPMPTK